MNTFENHQVTSQHLDHLGLVASTCHDLGIADKLDNLLGVHKDRRVSPGQAIVAMIINGLGFSARRLYLTRHFFQDKPTQLLLGADIVPEDLTDYTLGHTLEEVAEYGSSELFAKVAFDIALEHDLLGATAHLDSTSISVTGDYERVEGEEDEPPTIHLTHGFSKDHRPDLKQAVLSMVVNGPSQLPIWMEPLSGNSSDKTSFHETITKVRAFKRQIHLDGEFRWVADSALYSKDKLLGNTSYLWVTRVPETIGEAHELVAMPSEGLEWQELPDGYRYAVHRSSYGGVEQRWMLIHSKQAFEREMATFEKKLLKQQAELEKAVWHLGNQVFGCEADAIREVSKLTKKFGLFEFAFEIEPALSYAARGRPTKEQTGVTRGFQAKLSFSRNKQEVERQVEAKGRFILATNDLDESKYPNEKMLRDYKEQQHVEGGFRFLKDPWFMVDSVFLKSPKRIEALMMVMTLCLFVYNFSQFRLRQRLVDLDETLPNQLGKKVKNPTVKWIYQLMDGVGIVQMRSGVSGEPVREWVTNLTDLRQKIVWLFGETACRLYQINPKTSLVV